MSVITLAESARARTPVPRVDLRRELGAIRRLKVATPIGECIMPRDLYFELLAHECAYGSLPRRKPGDAICSGCQAPELSHGGPHRFCRDCEIERGTNLPSDWPYCAKCDLPFPTYTAGENGKGTWVAPSSDGSPICEACALEECCAGDVDAMIESQVGFGLASRREIQIMGRRCSAGSILNWVIRYAWSNRALFELLRLHRVSVVAVATAILRQSKRRVESALEPARA
jgi:hypothetical protein